MLKVGKVRLTNKEVERLRKGRKEFVQTVHNRHSYKRTAHAALVDVSRDDGFMDMSGGCHYFMRWRPSARDKKIMLLNYPGIPRSVDGESEYQDLSPEKLWRYAGDSGYRLWRAWWRFHLFLMNDELFGRAFLTETMYEAMTEGQLVDLDCPQVIAHTAMILSRWPTEFPRKLELWYLLVQQGIAPRKALWFAEGIRPMYGVSTLRWAGTGQGHDAFCVVNTRHHALRKMLKGELPSNADENHKQPYRRGYYQTDTCLAGKGGRLVAEAFLKHGKGYGGTYEEHKERDLWNECWLTEIRWTFKDVEEAGNVLGRAIKEFEI